MVKWFLGIALVCCLVALMFVKAASVESKETAARIAGRPSTLGMVNTDGVMAMPSSPSCGGFSWRYAVDGKTICVAWHGMSGFQE